MTRKVKAESKPNPYESLGDAGKDPEQLIRWLVGGKAAASDEDRESLNELLGSEEPKYSFAVVRDTVEKIWMRQEQARRYHGWEREDRALAGKLEEFCADNARLLKSSPTTERILRTRARRLADTMAKPTGPLPAAHREWAEKVLRDAGISKPDTRLLLRLLARK